jgi:hypothetical protein
MATCPWLRIPSVNRVFALTLTFDYPEVDTLFVNTSAFIGSNEYGSVDTGTQF